MSQSPTPSAASASAGSSGAAGVAWREDVQQAARNRQVREIAKVLASLEPGASATSKLRLAMQFEDSVFKTAESLADYQKKLTKRLTKLQKNYKPTTTAGATEKERAIEALRQNHGEAIRYVLKHASMAVKEMKVKNGEEKARQLEQHLDLVQTWAHDLGLLEGSGAGSKPNYGMADDQLERLKANVERRLENVRAHVVKFADPERFFAETLEKAEEDCHGPAAELIKTELKKFYKSELDPEKTIKEALAVTSKPIPLPTRSQRNDEKAALIYLEKMRAASSAYLAYMALDDKSTLAPKGTLKKIHTMAVEGIDFVAEVMKEHRKSSKEPEVSLQDAWLKVLEYNANNNNEADGGERADKRARISLRSSKLLTAGRKIPPSLLAEFHRKGAKLVRPPPHEQGSHLILEFGKAFVMIIYFVPLLVELRAYPETKEDPESDQDASALTTFIPWTPLHSGLTIDPQRNPVKDKDGKAVPKALTVWNVKSDYETCGHVVEERLRDASAHATFVLRQCFAQSTAGKKHVNDFEMEILEGQAIRDFLHLARNTYSPNWTDL